MCTPVWDSQSTDWSRLLFVLLLACKSIRVALLWDVYGAIYHYFHSNRLGRIAYPYILVCLISLTLAATDEYQMSRYGRDPRYKREPEIDSFRERSKSDATAYGEAFYLGAKAVQSGTMMPHRDRGYYGYDEGRGYAADSAESTDADTVYEVRATVAWCLQA